MSKTEAQVVLYDTEKCQSPGNQDVFKKGHFLLRVTVRLIVRNEVRNASVNIVLLKGHQPTSKIEGSHHFPHHSDIANVVMKMTW